MFVTNDLRGVLDFISGIALPIGDECCLVATVASSKVAMATPQSEALTSCQKIEANDLLSIDEKGDQCQKMCAGGGCR